MRWFSVLFLSGFRHCFKLTNRLSFEPINPKIVSIHGLAMVSHFKKCETSYFQTKINFMRGL